MSEVLQAQGEPLAGGSEKDRGQARVSENGRPPVMGYVVVVLTAIIWGFELVLIRRLVNQMSFAVVGYLSHFMTTALLLVGILTVRRGSLVQAWRDRLTVKRLVVIGAMGAVLNSMSFYGYHYTTAVNGAILARTDVLFALFISLFLLKERVGRSGWLAMALMLVGVCLIVMKDRSGLHVHVLGDVMILGSALLVAVNAVFIRQALTRTDPYVVSLANCFCIGFGFLAIAGVSDGLHGLVRGAAANAGGIALLGVALVGGFVLYYWALHLLPLWEVRILMLLTPVSSALLGALMLGEHMAPGQILGMGAVMAGAATISLTNRNVPMEQAANTEVIEADRA